MPAWNFPFQKRLCEDQTAGIFMGQIYHLNSDHDELLSEAEKAFDLSARRQSMLKNVRELPQTPRRPPALKTLAGLFVPAFRNQPN
jgi:hypothetical protein